MDDVMGADWKNRCSTSSPYARSTNTVHQEWEVATACEERPRVEETRSGESSRGMGKTRHVGFAPYGQQTAQEVTLFAAEAVCQFRF